MSHVLGVFAVAPGWHPGDLYTLALAAVGVTVPIGVAALSRQHERAFSASVLYVVLGAVGAVALSALDVRPLDPEGDHVLLERLTELALIVAVFSAGLTIERHVQRRSRVSIGTLLIVVMPLTILAIAIFGMWAMGLSFGAALLLGAVLAPTDPVLAGDVGLSAPGGEVFGEPRLSLHTEAGFNDGLASPFVVLGLFAAGRGGTGWIGQWLAADLLYGVGAALGLGAAAGFAAAALLTRARNRGLVSGGLEGFVSIGMVLIIYGVTEAIGAYGLLAVFAAGFTFRRYEFDHEMHRPVHRGAEAAGKMLELLVLLMLGTMLTTEGLSAPGAAGWLLAPLLLLVIRPALVFATADPKLMDRRGGLFLAFFGVRGVAALFYAAVVVEAHALNPSEQHIVVWTSIVCVVTSIVAHGLSARPLTRRWLGSP
ncbi:MAG TPA: cation:proton antiporter [Solirubrobacteraceae bacterium]|nr:cation:proton antiporter [Solirubrobacteraceae bacterium]